MDTMALFRQRFLQAILAAAALGAPVAHSAPPLTVPPDPLGTSSSSITPNVMMILDDSGSMTWDYMPDYVGNAAGGCAADGTTTTLSNTAVTCGAGDPPFASPDFNGVYYNPAISYRPGANADGTDMTSMTSANTTGWTKVLTDPYLSFGDQPRYRLLSTA
jgi:type IV pilus assembly protein PilY1